MPAPRTADSVSRAVLARTEGDGGTAPAAPLPISRKGGIGATFLSNEQITLETTAPAGADGKPAAINWSVKAGSADDGTVSPATSTENVFTFTPKPAKRPVAGSRAPNPPIKYTVEARTGSSVGTFALEQDETDRIRQEYLDHNGTPPEREKIVAPAVAGFNTGNYSLILDGGMPAALAATKAKFEALTRAAAAPKDGGTEAAPDAGTPAPADGDTPAAETPAPADGGAPTAETPAPVAVPEILVESGYRNPQRNVAAQSKFPVTSKHTLGRALDLEFAAPTAELWTRLRQAGQDAGYSSLCEASNEPKPCSDATVNHVHIQW